MLPTGHVEFTWSALNALQHAGLFEDADYRGVALAGLAPDLIDKPLAVYVLPGEQATLLFAHTLLAQIAVWAGVLAGGKRWLPYALAFTAHVVEDRIWEFPQTFLWPFRGRRFHRWRHVGSPKAFVQAYTHILQQERLLPIFEAAGLGLLIGMVLDRKLYLPRRLGRFLRTGRMPE